VRRPTHGTDQQVLDLPLQHRVGHEANGVPIAFLLQHAVQRWIGKRRIAAKELGDIQVAIPRDHWQEAHAARTSRWRDCPAAA